MDTISAEEFYKKVSEASILPAQIIDVRTPAEFREVSVEGSTLLPLDLISDEKLKAATPGDAIYILCKTGARSAKAQGKLSSPDTVVVLGGIEALAAEGFPLNRGKATMSLERQVRIAAGSMVFIGTLLGFFINSLFLIVPGFVGAGLAFAGLTDTCGMGMMLAKMPWNRA